VSTGKQNILHKEIVTLGAQCRREDGRATAERTDMSYLSAFVSEALPIFESCNYRKNGWTSPENKAIEVFSLPTPTRLVLPHPPGWNLVLTLAGPSPVL